ncbi:hypothetical protein ABEO76_09900 [Bacillus anthracis]|uniref:hypothetical protein n=1 Tax=Bacillus anthracis TaxID=1392 RepID=UPI003D23A548
MRATFSYSVSEDTLLTVDDKLDIYSEKEYLQIKEKFDLSKDKQSVRRVIQTLGADGLLSKRALSNISTEYMNDLIQYQKIELTTYLVINMLFGRLPMNRELIENAIYKVNTKRKKVLFYVYEKMKPSYFPNLADLDDEYGRLQLFYISLALFYKPYKLNDDVVVKELERHFGNIGEDSIFVAYKGNKLNRIKQFVTLSSSDFIEKGYLIPREDLIQYLYNKTMGKETYGEEEKLLMYFSNRMDKYKDTEFYSALKNVVEESLNKMRMKFRTIDGWIRHWADFIDFAVDNGCVDLKDITPLLRDLYIDEYLDEKSLVYDFGSIRIIIRDFNQRKFGSNMDAYIDETIFSQVHIPKKPKDTTHVSFMEAAHDALISSIASDIYQSRADQALGINSEEHFKRFFLSRLIWLIFLTGARNSEIRTLELKKVKTTLLYSNPYIVIKTKKKNPDRVFELYRGVNLEYDKVHLDILNETIEVAENIYKKTMHPGADQWLFPNQFLSHFTHDSLRNYFNNVQKRNAIICGSHYDIMQRDLYVSYPDMVKKIEEPTPLFALHEIRHMHIDKLVLYGMTNQIELAKTIGHQGVESQEIYKKAAFGVLEVSKIMEENQHYGAANKLVSSVSFKVDENVSRDKLLLIEDIDTYMGELEKDRDINVEQAIDYIDINTNCETKISCGETGFGCLGCKDFVSGKATHEAILNTAVLLENQMKVIDYEIQRINDKKLRKKNKFNHFQELLMTILDRFEGIELAKDRTLISTDNFGWTEDEAEKFMARLMKRVRKVDVEKDVIKMVKNELCAGRLHEDIVSRLNLIVSKTNKKVFV